MKKAMPVTSRDTTDTCYCIFSTYSHYDPKLLDAYSITKQLEKFFI